MTSKVSYQGNLRTECTHIRSGNTFITDAPVDNNGKGEAFSPTDTVATALASCMLTVMGIKAQQKGIDIDGSHAEVQKTMQDTPRKIAKVEVVLHLPKDIPDKDKKILENTAITCPVYQSLHPDMEKQVAFNWDL